jgi:small subunit ribosomal protein S14
MAKKSQIARQKKREKLVKKYAAKRTELKNRARDQSLTHEERMEARGQLSKLPRSSSPVRLSTRCIVSGRSRAVYREFGLSRITFREMALEGKLPGIKKASW